MRQGELMWRTAYAVPVIAISVFAGWFAMAKAPDPEFWQKAVLAVGVLAMLFNFLILRRMAQFFTAHGNTIEHLMPEVGDPLLKLTGNRLAMATPLLSAILFAAMLFFV